MLEGVGIEVRIDLPGVGRNLQDRYEICVLNRMSFEQWECLKDARFDSDDPLYRAWAAGEDSLYATNGAGLGVIARSAPERPLPDLFCMPFLGRFFGYFPGYASALADQPNYLSWSILKAHTENRAGQVSLRSADPRDPPKVAFRYFEEGSDPTGQDLAAVISGIRFVRSITERLKAEGLIDRGGAARRGAPVGRGARCVRSGQRLGSPRLLQLRDRPPRTRWRARRQASRAWRLRPPRRRRLGVPADSRLLHCKRRLHGRRESGRSYSCRCADGFQ